MKKNARLPFIFGFTLLITVLLFYFYVPNPTAAQQIILRFALASSTALLTVGFVGMINFKTIGIKATSGFAVFLIVLFFDPTGGENTYFSYTVFFEDTDELSLLQIDGEVTLKVGNEKRTAKIDINNSVNFKNIPSIYEKDTVYLMLRSKGWVFDNNRLRRELFLEGNNATISVKRDNSLCCISGYVRNSQDEFMKNVELRIGNISATTDSLGFFHFELPLALQKEEQNLIVFHNNYISWESTIYPANKQVVQIQLKDKK